MNLLYTVAVKGLKLMTWSYVVEVSILNHDSIGNLHDMGILIRLQSKVA